MMDQDGQLRRLSCRYIDSFADNNCPSTVLSTKLLYRVAGFCQLSAGNPRRVIVRGLLCAAAGVR